MYRAEREKFQLRWPYRRNIGRLLAGPIFGTSMVRRFGFVLEVRRRLSMYRSELVR